MKIAIVGTSVKLTESEKNDIRASLIFVLSYYPAESIIISGGATGVDKLAIDVAKEVGFTTKDYLPEKNEWKYYKNLPTVSSGERLTKLQFSHRI